MDCSLQGSSVHWILQARLLEWVVMTSSRGNLPNPGIGPLSLGSSVLADGFFTWEKKSVTWEAHEDECYTHECQGGGQFLRRFLHLQRRVYLFTEQGPQMRGPSPDLSLVSSFLLYSSLLAFQQLRLTITV